MFKNADGSVMGWVTGTPMTYMHSEKQYIVTAITGAGAKTYLSALALP